MTQGIPFPPVGESIAYVTDTSGNKVQMVALSEDVMTASALVNAYFGSGADGDATISSAITLTRDMYYRNLTLAAGAAINVASFRIFVSGILDVTSAPTGAIQNNGVAGGDAAGINAGAAAVAILTAGKTWSNTAAAPAAGKAGGTTVGTAGGANPAVVHVCGGHCGATGGAGGTGSSGIGGVVGTDAAATATQTIYCTPVLSPSMPNTPGIGVSGPSGGSGGGDGTAGGGSGGGGIGGYMIGIWARKILRSSANTNAGIIQAKGGRGGNGAAPAGGNRGGGGGACGCGGGNIYIMCGELDGSAQPNAIDVSGGAGGNGGAGTGTGTAGQGAQAGFGGVVQVLNMALGTCAVFDGRAIGGAANVTVTGGASTPAQASL